HIIQTMANEPNELRRQTLPRLRQELVADVELANNLLHELNRYLDQLRTRAPELLRVEALPDDPLIKYGCLDKLPTRLNLSLRGIDIPSIICPNCPN
ncbi:hypothetical protein Tco_0483077, partial [Tanacetum coccineum]